MTSSNPPANILVVDDQPSNRLAIEAILAPLGQRLVHATSGEEALWHALREDFAVVLLDVQMPEMDGFECAQLLRRRPRTRDVPIIFLSAISKEQRFISRGYDVGAVDYLLKPYDPDVLRSKVKVFVELAQKNAIIRSQHEALQRMSERELADYKRWSEKRYADLADSMPQIVWASDAEGRVTYANRRWAELAPDSFDFRDVVHPDDLEHFLRGWQGAVDSGTGWEDELRFGNAKVGFRSHLVRAVPRRSADGKTEAWIGTSTDIDARVRAAGALSMLAEASRRLGSALDEPSELEDVVRLVLPVLGDAAMLEFHGSSGPRRTVAAIDELDPRFLDDHRLELGPATVAYSGVSEIHLDVANELSEVRAPRSGDDRGRSRWDHLSFLGELRVAGYMCLPLAARGPAIGTLTFLRMTKPYEAADTALAEDVARRVAVAIENARLHETTERRRVELEEANKSKDVFLATLSHELRTPLNAIVGWTDMMRNGSLAESEFARAVDTIDRNAHALSQLVADLLDVSRIVTGTLKIDSTLVGLASIVESVVDNARPQCKTKRVTLDVSLEPVGSVNGDAGRLRQVLGNLLSNAIKFTPEGGTIRVRLTRDADLARIVVQDSGEGIASDLLPHVFDRFRQAETARSRGLGLGLAIVKHLVEEHDGTVAAASEGQGKGAMFTVELPIASDEAKSTEAPAASVLPPSGQPMLDGVHALVVEDDPDGNELITTILQRYGARVTSVGTAAGALDALDGERPDILVSDIGLPDADGIELIKMVRDRAPGKDLPAIALTAYASRQDAAKAISAGFDAHVAKPVQPGTLGSEVARLVARKATPINRQPAA